MKKIETFNEFNMLKTTDTKKDVEIKKDSHILYFDKLKNHNLSKKEINDKLKNDVWFG